MPSILIEMGFLSNAEDEKYLSNDQNRAAVADAIFRAFASYYTQTTGNKLNLPDVNTKENQNKSNDNTTQSHDNNNNNSVDNQSDTKVSVEEAPVVSPPVDPDGIRFMVQFMALPDKIALTDKRFKSIPNVDCYHEGNLWKYTAGSESNLQSAKEILKEVQTKYPDAFIIAFKGDQKIPVSEAVKLQKK